MVARLSPLNMVYTVFSNPKSETFAVSKTPHRCVKQENECFVICPKQGPEMMGVVLNRVYTLGHVCPNQPWTVDILNMKGVVIFIFSLHLEQTSQHSHPPPFSIDMWTPLFTLWNDLEWNFYCHQTFTPTTLNNYFLTRWEKLCCICFAAMCNNAEHMCARGRNINLHNWTTMDIIDQGGQTRSAMLSDVVSRCRLPFLHSFNIVQQSCI